MKTTSSRKDTLRGVLGYVGRYRGYLVASMALCVITVASTLYVPILTGNAVDLLLGPGAVDFAALWAHSGRHPGAGSPDGPGPVADGPVQ